MTLPKMEDVGALAFFGFFALSILASIGLPIVLIWAVIRLIVRFT